MTASLVLWGIACVRGDRPLFEGLDLSLAPGGAAVVTGVNGAGKSSLLRIAAGLSQAAAGTVTRAGRVAWMGEAAALDPDRTLGAAIGWYARLDGGDAGTALAMVGLDHLAEVPVRYLSTGQRRRAAFARVLAARADLWLLDEPTSGMDAAAAALVADAVDRHRAGGGIALIATHHALDLADATEVRL